jgi:Cys-tRNA(Pro)/Cys-tRNA(Cys) deacylase
MNNFKTNAMRILDKAGISYNTYTYEHSDGLIDGISVAKKMGQPIEQVYKTLVTQGASRDFFVFVIPVAEELDLKAAARSVNEKAVEMIKVADINKVTGYIRGGCSPIGMKKDYKMVLDSSCKVLDTFIVSAGKIGHQIEMSPNDLIGLIHCSTESIIMQKNTNIS